jgi:hypothetical protein
MKYSTSTITRYRIMADSEKYLDNGRVDFIYRPSTGEIASRDESISRKSIPANVGEISVPQLFLLLEKNP